MADSSCDCRSSQIIDILYSIVNRMYIGRIPNTRAIALTGIGVTFPILMLISAFSALMGMGRAPRAAISVRQGHFSAAERIIGNY